MLLRLTRTELRLNLREPVPAFFSLLAPTILVVVLGSVPALREPSAGLGGKRVIDAYVGIAVALSLAMVALQVMPMVLATYRERGILRRFATTPVPPLILLSAQVLATLVTAVTAALIAIAVGRIGYGVPLPADPAAFVVAFLLCAAGVFAVGLLVAAVAPTGRAGNSIGNLLFFPLMFFAGLWTPRELLPHTVARIGDFTPLGAGERALHQASAGTWPNPLSVTVLVAYLAVFGLASARLFRWR
ncbi:ABC-2 type transport system permease protein [Asanoa ferruginea]|uniref:Transport permease protein n=1 Tax=Asanoa ferruginea TaxID=53367 RepID=A0A3D9ZWD1_9ACTN|nr:ABC transporter permease [Asanoa ferruginea]REG01320.1 ABC-2 type transport system permease protein [Asanoa ferruginea]GIF52190.1 transport permease protein [Asanoa ferruginea]